MSTDQRTTYLVIGAGGMLGTAFCRELEARGLPFEAVDMNEDSEAGIGSFDMTLAADLSTIASGRFGVVINCAAWTDVDGAETNEQGAARLNGEAVGGLASACAAGGAVCVHFSTDYVFDGAGTEPYPTDHPIAPINAYGRTKATGERLLVESGAEHILIRTSWLYGPWGKNFVLTMRSLMSTRDTLRVVADQRGRPTSVQQLAKTTLGLLKNSARGTFHASDGGECTWHGFASEIRDAIGASTAIEPCTTDEFPRPATRPAYSVLDLSRTVELVGEPTAWNEELRRVIAEIGTA